MSLVGVSYKEIRRLLNERGQANRFLSDADRDAVIDSLETWYYSDVNEYDGDDVYNLAINTSFAYDISTDAELMDEVKQVVEEYEGELDNRVMNIYTTWVVEKEVLS